MQISVFEFKIGNRSTVLVLEAFRVRFYCYKEMEPAPRSLSPLDVVEMSK